MKNYAIKPSELPFLTYIPSKTPLEVLQESVSIHKVHPSAKAVPVDRGIRSLGNYLGTIKWEGLIIMG